MKTKKFNILLVEDDDSIRRSLAAFFEDYDIEVLEAENAEIGLEIFKEVKVDVMIVDLRLPGMSGEEFAQEVLKITDKVGIIIHTGSPQFELSEELRRNKCVSNIIFEKPVKDLEEIRIEAERLSKKCSK